jgi:hypothetical protein
VSNHQRGVHPNHDGRTQITVSDPRRWDLPVPFGDQRPHVLAGLGSLTGNLAVLELADFVQSSPQRRVRGHRPIQLTLIPQRGQVRQHPPAICDQHRRIRQHSAPVVERHEPAPGQRPRQSGGQAGAVGEQPQRRRPGVIDHVAATDFNRKILRP